MVVLSGCSEKSSIADVNEEEEYTPVEIERVRSEQYLIIPS